MLVHHAERPAAVPATSRSRRYEVGRRARVGLRGPRDRAGQEPNAKIAGAARRLRVHRDGRQPEPRALRLRPRAGERRPGARPGRVAPLGSRRWARRGRTTCWRSSTSRGMLRAEPEAQTPLGEHRRRAGPVQGLQRLREHGGSAEEIARWQQVAAEQRASEQQAPREAGSASESCGVRWSGRWGRSWSSCRWGRRRSPGPRADAGAGDSSLLRRCARAQRDAAGDHRGQRAGAVRDRRQARRGRGGSRRSIRCCGPIGKSADELFAEHPAQRRRRPEGRASRCSTGR